MAPEQAAGEQHRVGPWTDIYSVGVLLYRMLTGRLPFEGSALKLLAQVVHDPPLAPSCLRPDVDPVLEAVILKAMAREPGARYQSAHQFNEALTAWASPPTSDTGAMMKTGQQPEGSPALAARSELGRDSAPGVVGDRQQGARR